MPDFTFSESDQEMFGIPYASRAEIAEHRAELARVNPAPVHPTADEINAHVRQAARRRRARMRATPGPHTINSIRLLLDANDKAVERAVVVIWGRQTESERSVRSTTEHNGVGFTGVDAEFLSSLAEWINNSRKPAGQRLSPAQLIHARRRIRKYAKQLAEVANEKAAREHSA